MVLAFSDPVMQRFSWRTTPYTETDARDYIAEQEEARLRGDDFADLCVDTDDYNVRRLARHVRERAGGWPRLTHCLE